MDIYIRADLPLIVVRNGGHAIQLSFEEAKAAKEKLEAILTNPEISRELRRYNWLKDAEKEMGNQKKETAEKIKELSKNV